MPCIKSRSACVSEYLLDNLPPLLLLLLLS
jgi:hypothetical protein